MSEEFKQDDGSYRVGLFPQDSSNATWLGNFREIEVDGQKVKARIVLNSRYEEGSNKPKYLLELVGEYALYPQEDHSRDGLKHGRPVKIGNHEFWANMYPNKFADENPKAPPHNLVLKPVDPSKSSRPASSAPPTASNEVPF